MLSLEEKGIFCLHSLEIVEDDSLSASACPATPGASQLEAIKEVIRKAQSGKLEHTVSESLTSPAF